MATGSGVASTLVTCGVGVGVTTMTVTCGVWGAVGPQVVRTRIVVSRVPRTKEGPLGIISYLQVEKGIVVPPP
jgi:hypothetical protein